METITCALDLPARSVDMVRALFYISTSHDLFCFVVSVREGSAGHHGLREEVRVTLCAHAGGEVC